MEPWVVLYNGRPRLGLTEMGVAKCVCCFQLRTHGRGLLVGIKNDAMKKEETLKFKHREDVQGPHVWHPGEGEADEETSYLELTGPDAEQSGVGLELALKNEERIELNIVV